VLESWRAIIRRPEVARVYVRLLIARIEVQQRSIVITQRSVGETKRSRFRPPSSLENEQNRGPCRDRGFSHYRQTVLGEGFNLPTLCGRRVKKPGALRIGDSAQNLIPIYGSDLRSH